MSSVQWRLWAWQSGERLYRHWIDPELALEWARRYQRARAAGDVFAAADAHRRWWEAANLGAYAMRAVGIDPLSAPLARFTLEGPAGARGLPGAPIELGRMLAATARVQEAPKTAGPSMPARCLWTPRTRIRVYRYGAVQTTERSPDGLSEGLSDELRSFVSTVIDSRGLDTGRAEHRLHETLAALGIEGPSDTFVRDAKARGTFPSWATWDIRQIPGLTLAARWHPEGLDGWWEIVWVDANEARLRMTAALAIRGRMEPEFYDFPDGRAPFFGAPAVAQERWVSLPLDVLPDGWIRDQEIASFIADPWQWIEGYWGAVIDRNRVALTQIDRTLANRAEGVSLSREAATAASMIAVDRAVRASREENLAALDEVATFMNVVPVLGQIASGMAALFGRLLAAFGAFDMPDAQRAAILRDTIAPLAIGGTLSGTEPRPPTHSVFVPYGWERPSSVAGPLGLAPFASPPPQGPTARAFDPGAPRVAGGGGGELRSTATTSRADYYPPRAYVDLFDLNDLDSAERRYGGTVDTPRDERSSGVGIFLGIASLIAAGLLYKSRSR